MVTAAAGSLGRQLPEFGIRMCESALDELRAVPALLGSGAMALSPADTCPDNNVTT